MAHGFGGTRDSGLLPFAEAFADAGMDALVFDYRGFGDSAGHPRQLVSYRRHRRDYAAAVKFARSIDGVDPTRIALWGSSYGGGHALSVAAHDRQIKALVAQVAAVDGLATVRGALRSSGISYLLKANVAASRDVWRMLLRQSPFLLPIVGPPGSLAAMNSVDSLPGMMAFAGPRWRNEFAARELLAAPLNRPISKARRVRCPVLVQVGDTDAVAAPETLERLARRLGGHVEVCRYPTGHFDVYVEPWRTPNIDDQVGFLRRQLAVPTSSTVTKR
ncbi:alpha/beta hydrolase [Mycolicibacterium setense]